MKIRRKVFPFFVQVIHKHHFDGVCLKLLSQNTYI